MSHCRPHSEDGVRRVHGAEHTVLPCEQKEEGVFSSLGSAGGWVAPFKCYQLVFLLANVQFHCLLLEQTIKAGGRAWGTC